MSANSFSFGNHPITVINDADTLWFIAAEIVKAINLSNPSVSLKSLRPAERKKIVLQGRETNIISESGMYTLVLRSQDALKEGTAAFRFRVWVTDEVLPTIRRNGQYNAACPATITPAEQLQIQQAVARRAKTSSANYQTIYRAIKVRFQIPRYNELPRCQFAECLKFIDAVDLKVPEAKTAAAPVFENPFTPEELAASPEKPPKGYAYRVSAEFLDNQRTFVYYWRYLFRRELELFEEFLYRTESPRAARFHEAVHNMNLTGIEDQLRRLGFPMDELPCYQHYVGRLAAA